MDLVVDVLFLSQLVLLVLLLRGFFRPYFVLFSYVLISQIQISLGPWFGRSYGFTSAAYGYLFWLQEVTVDLLLLAMVMLFLARAQPTDSLRSAARKVLAACLLGAIALPFLFGRIPVIQSGDQHFLSSRWFNISSQILNFGAAVLNMILWTALISSRHRDPQSFAVSAGLGITVAGQAIYYGVRLLSHSAWLREAAQGFGLLAQIVSALIWCWAFWPSRRAAPSVKASSSPGRV